MHIVFQFSQTLQSTLAFTKYNKCNIFLILRKHMYVKITNKCVKRQYSTLFNNITEKNILVTDNYILEQYKQDQNKIKTLPLSQ